MANLQDELLQLQQRVVDLTRRVYQLEVASGLVKPPEPAVSAPPPPPPVAAPAFGDAAAPTLQATPPVVAQPAPGAKPPKDRNLENVIGSQWLNRIGVIALLIGAAYFLKLAFDNDWIGPSGRIAIGLMAGIALVAWGSRIHSRGYKYFAYSMTSVGIGVMYLSLWAAFQLYHLLPAAAAFLAMILVTASAVALALRMDAEILAAVALAGGFSTPALLSTGENRPVELFTYLAILNLFAIVLVTVRPWRRLLLGGFIATSIYYIGWSAQYYIRDLRTVAVLFTTLNFALFASLPLLRRLYPSASAEAKAVTHTRSKTLIVVALLNPVIYFAHLYYMFEGDHAQAMAWVAVLLAAVYIGMSRQLDRELESYPEGQKFEKWLHLAIGIGFLTLAIPIKLESHWITMGWFVEAAALLWVGDRAKSVFLRNAAIAALVLGVVRLLFIDNFVTDRTIFNARFATFLVGIAVLTGIAIQVRRQYGAKHKGLAVAILAINILSLVALNYEVADYFSRQYQTMNANAPNLDYSNQNWQGVGRARDFTYSALWMIYGTAVLFIGFWRKSPFLRWQALFLIAVTIVKVFLYDLSNISGGYRVLSFIALGAILMGISFMYQKGWLKLSAEDETKEVDKPEATK